MNHQTFISDSVQIVVDNTMFSLRATEEISGANIFKHMVVGNIDSNGQALVSSKSGTGRNIAGNNDPDSVSANAEDVISEFRSPINDVLRQPEEEDNGEAMILKVIEMEVGQLISVSAKYADGDKEQATGSYPINDKLNLFPEEVVGPIRRYWACEGNEPGSPMQQVEELGCHSVEALDCVSRLRGLQVASWASLGSLHKQANASEAPSRDIADVSIQNQK
ncbi:hypothetical protein Ancab_016263 [Ancistrocladus abbreviatus]